MIRKRYSDKESAEKANDAIQRRVRKIWILFFIALITEALQVRPSKITVSSVEIDLQNAAQIPGLFYFATFVYSIYVVSQLVFIGIQPPASRIETLRTLIFIFSGKRKTLLRIKRHDVLLIKMQVKFILILLYTYLFSVLLFPIVTIILFKMPQVIRAFKLVVWGT